VLKEELLKAGVPEKHTKFIMELPMNLVAKHWKPEWKEVFGERPETEPETGPEMPVEPKMSSTVSPPVEEKENPFVNEDYDFGFPDNKNATEAKNATVSEVPKNATVGVVGKNATSASNGKDNDEEETDDDEDKDEIEDDEKDNEKKTKKPKKTKSDAYAYDDEDEDPYAGKFKAGQLMINSNYIPERYDSNYGQYFPATYKFGMKQSALAMQVGTLLSLTVVATSLF